MSTWIVWMRGDVNMDSLWMRRDVNMDSLDERGCQHG